MLDHNIAVAPWYVRVVLDAPLWPVVWLWAILGTLQNLTDERFGLLMLALAWLFARVGLRAMGWSKLQVPIFVTDDKGQEWRGFAMVIRRK